MGFILPIRLPYSASELACACLEIIKGFDICLGQRQEIPTKEISRSFAHRFFKQIVRVLLKNNIHDTQCGMKAFSRSAVFKILGLSRLSGFLFDLEWIYIASKNNFAVSKLSVTVSSNHRASNLGHFLKWPLLKEATFFIFKMLLKQYTIRYEVFPYATSSQSAAVEPLEFSQNPEKVVQGI
jgi:hypothetical protein